MIVWSALTLTLTMVSATEPVPSPDLSGSWSPDPSRYTSEKRLKQVDPSAPPAPPAPPAGAPQLPALRIGQREAAIVIEFLEPDGTFISALRLSTDGRENVNERAGGALQHVSRSHWETDSLVTIWRLQRGGAAMLTGTDRWRLSTDRTTLTLSSSLEDARSNTESTTVYIRK